MALLEDLQHLAAHLSPSDTGSSDPVLGALIKVLEADGVKVPAVSELLPEDHPSQISPPAPAAGQPSADSRALADLTAKVEALLGHFGQQTTPESTSDGPELDRP